MQKLKIFLIADIYPKNESLELFQEWESKESIFILKDTLEEMGHSVKIFEPFRNKKELLENLVKASFERENTVLWNLVEGYSSRNREAYIPAFAEFLGFPFTGSDSYAQILSLDKALTKQLVQELKIPTPKFQLIENFENFPNLEFPIFIKPNWEGSSLGISEQNQITSYKDWDKFRKNANPNYKPYLVEEFLEGREYTVGILGSRKQLFSTKVLEVIYPTSVYSTEIKSKY
ncbi:MAG: D-alanine--D-alanine ligase, partial [Leptospiraceae bacterium]|nr:D-alanine--D-alanine ligase [Leptospiraceae bacterium]